MSLLKIRLTGAQNKEHERKYCNLSHPHNDSSIFEAIGYKDKYL